MPPNLQTAVKPIIKAALHAVDPYHAVKSHLMLNETTGRLHCGSHSYPLEKFKRVRVLGFGKAGAPMALATADILGHHLSDGLVLVKYGHVLPPEQAQHLPPSLKIETAGHPVPDKNSLIHGQALLKMALTCTTDDLVLCLISGGGSALLTQPAGGISLSDLQTVTGNLLKAGATIKQINTVRKHLSQVKGGHLARHLAPATVISLILSDVGGDPLEAIASGPTAPDPSTFAEALAVLDRYNLRAATPVAVLSHLLAGAAGQQPETLKPNDPIFKRVQNHIIANNHLALHAAAQKASELGFQTQIQAEFVEGEAREVAHRSVQQALNLAQKPSDDRPAALLFGGETTVTLHGNGLGGRNQEMALAAALALSEANAGNKILLAFFATDGNDGPTDAAGGIATAQTIARAEALGLNPADYLARNDSYRLLKATGDLLITGPSNTNVNDLALILVG